MDNILEFIFDNFFLIFIIIGIISTMMSGKKEKQKASQRSSSHNPIPTNIEDYQTEEQSTSTATTMNSSVSIEEEKQKQLGGLVGQLEGNSKQTKQSIDQSLSKVEDHQKVAFDEPSVQEMKKFFNSHQEDQLIKKEQIQKRVTPKGLAESVLMAEILGPPRAKKPYRSITSERRQLK